MSNLVYSVVSNHQFVGDSNGHIDCSGDVCLLCSRVGSEGSSNLTYILLDKTVLKPCFSVSVFAFSLRMMG